jgi:hypothetical protein
MDRIVLAIVVVLWAATGCAADSTMGDFDVGDLNTHRASPALDTGGFTAGRSGAIEASEVTALIQGASTGQQFDSLRGLFDASTNFERPAPTAAQFHQAHQPSGGLGDGFSVAPTSSDLGFQTAGPHGSAPQTLYRSSTPPSFVRPRSDGPRLIAILPWAGLAIAGLLIIWTVAAAGNSRTA